MIESDGFLFLSQEKYHKFILCKEIERLKKSDSHSVYNDVYIDNHKNANFNHKRLIQIGRYAL